MTHVIVQNCCNDASCVAVCPVDCISPTPNDPDFMRAEMLHIDPDVCIDCGACIDECPVDAIRPDDELEDGQEEYLNLNAEYFAVQNPSSDAPASAPPKPWRKSDVTDMRVAIVGSGPSAFYTALDLVSLRVGHVEMIEKLLTPYGLVRFGVAPDHLATKNVTEMFRSLAKKPNFTLDLGVEVGEHVTHVELTEHFDAVVYAVGAASDRRLGIPGEDLAGSHAATDFVGWYNGHPDKADLRFDLSGEHAVVVGNGNVALDVARVLLADPEDLVDSDIAEHALEALRSSSIRTVTLVGRRGIGQAAYTNPEFLALLDMPNIDVVIDPADVESDDVARGILADPEASSHVRAKIRYATEVAQRGATGRPKQLRMRYLASPQAIVGDGRVEALVVGRNRLEVDGSGSVVPRDTGVTDPLPCDLLLRSVGYRGTAVPALPFDDQRGIVPNERGRVVDPATGDPVAKTYVTGWIKRGPSGVIGSNKQCALETVDLLLQDRLDGRLSPPRHAPEAFGEVVRMRQPDVLHFDDWTRIDRAERDAGKATSRPRIKFIDPGSMMAVVRARSAS